MSELLEQVRRELHTLIKEEMAKAIAELLTEFGLKPRDIKPWVSKNKASQLIGRKRLERAMREGKVEFRKPDEKRNSRVNVSMRDIIKLIKQPEL